MPVELEIRDGNPWWLSPDIWVVPGDDPEGPEGAPVAGQPAFLWARVHNRGSSPVNDAEVKFYWADPSSGFDRNTASYIGSSWVSLAGGETADVLLLAPWIPEHVNNGHECVLAEAGHPGLDPLPASPAFNTPTDRHVAQRNLTVLEASPDGFFRMSFSVFNTSRKASNFSLNLDTGSPADLSRLRGLSELIVKDIALDDGLPDRLTISEWPCPDREHLEKKTQSSRSVNIPAQSSLRLSLAGLSGKRPSLVHVGQYDGNRLIGGFSVFILPPAGQKKDAAKPASRQAAGRKKAG